MRGLAFVVAAGLLAACMPQEDAGACADYTGLLGANIAAVTLPADPNIRVYAVNDPVTQDLRLDRTNIVYDDTGTIIRVFCG